MRTAPTKVYRIVRRPIDQPDAEWVPFTTYTSNTFRPYVSLASAKGVVANNKRYRKGFEWAIQVSELTWEMV